MRTRGLMVSALIGVAALLSSIPTALVPATGHALQPAAGLTPISRNREVSSNWSGYSIDRTGTTFSQVTGSWVQPSGTCVKNSNQLAAFYTGIDGDNSPSVEQIGTEVDCSHSAPIYYAWYEMYPAPAHLISDCVIKPNDGLTSTVQWNAATQDFTLTLTDNGAGGGSCGASGTFSTTLTAPGPTARSSAEWIAESPATGGHLWPLTNFGTINFTNGSATSDSGSGHTGSIADNTAWDVHELIMATVVGSPNAPKIKDVRADPESSLTGGSFHVRWANP